MCAIKWYYISNVHENVHAIHMKTEERVKISIMLLKSQQMDKQYVIWEGGWSAFCAIQALIQLLHLKYAKM